MRSYALLWSAGLISRIGNQAFVIGLVYHLYEHTGSTAAVSGLFVALSIPGLFLASSAGVLADRWNPKKQMLLVNAVQAVAMIVLAVGGQSDLLWLAYAIALIDAAAGHFFLPASEAALPVIVPQAQLIPAYSLDASSGSVARIVGPVVGGIVVGGWGLTGLALVNAATFVASACLIALVKFPLSDRRSGRIPDLDGKGTGTAIINEFRAGMREVGRRPALLAILFAAAVAMLAEAMFRTVLVPFTNDALDAASPELVGLVAGLRGVTALATGVTVGARGSHFQPLRLFGMALFALAVIMSLMASISWPQLAVVLVILTGVPAVAWFASQMTLLQLLTPQPYKGRVFGIFHTIRSWTVLVAGLLLLAFGDILMPRGVLLVAGLLLVAASILVLRAQGLTRAALADEPERSTNTGARGP